MKGLWRGALAAAGALAASQTVAADLPTKKQEPVPLPALPSKWRFEITGYGWASSVAGNVGYGVFPSEPYYAPFGKVLEHLEGAFMGSAIARDGQYIVGVDGIWSRIGGSGTVELKNSRTGADLTLTEGLVTAFGGLRIPFGPPNLELYGTVGARYTYTGTKLTLSAPLSGLSLSQSVDKGWVNPLAGFAAHYRFNDRWFMNVFGDLGGWSKSATGQALASVGYNWTQNIATTIGYRVLYTYETQDTGFNDVLGVSKSFRYQQWMYGPFVGFKYSF